MNEDEEFGQRLTENEHIINTICEIPRRPWKYRVTMEVPLFITMLAISLSGAVISNIVLYRTCVHALHHPKDVCHMFLAPERSNTTKKLEEEVQKYTTYVTVVKTVLESLGPAVSSLFLGVWSDTYGRKPLVVWPMFGMSISTIMLVIYSMLDDFGPWWYIFTVIPSSLTGGFSALFTGAYTYISDITTTENRSFRMTILEVSTSAGTFLGAILSSYLIKAIGNVYLLLVIAALYVTGYVFTNVFLTESLNGAQKGGLSTLMDVRLIKEMMSTCFKWRPNNGRAIILLLAMCNTLSTFILCGLMTLTYLYTREKLHWAVKEYSTYSAVGTLISVAGAMVGVKIGSKLLKIGDLPLAIVGYVCAVVEYVVITFAVKGWHMYLGSALAVFKELSAPLIKSHLTKVLPVEDIAKAFALLCAFEAICPMFSPVIYNTLYRYTLTTFPGAIYLLSALITSVCVVMIGVIQYFSWKHSSSYLILQMDESS